MTTVPLHVSVNTEPSEAPPETIPMTIDGDGRLITARRPAPGPFVALYRRLARAEEALKVNPSDSAAQFAMIEVLEGTVRAIFTPESADYILAAVGDPAHPWDYEPHIRLAITALGERWSGHPSGGSESSPSSPATSGPDSTATSPSAVSTPTPSPFIASATPS